MDRFTESASTLEHVLEVERSYKCVNTESYRAPQSTGTGRSLPATILVALLAAAPCAVPRLVAPALTLTEVAALSKKTAAATNESADFRDLVRQHGHAPILRLPPPLLELEPVIELGDLDFYDSFDLLPACVPTDVFEAYVTTTQAEPSLKDLDAESFYVIDDLV